jgi:RNA recognition motif-containing protein
VSNFTYNTSAQELGEAFMKFGDIVNVRILTRVNRFGAQRSMGFGFVEFATAEAAAAAAAVDPPIELDGQPLETALAKAEQQQIHDTIHISGIPTGTTPGDLLAIFGKYNVLDVKIVREDSDQRKGFAHVQFDSEEHQTAAQIENKVIRLTGAESQVESARRSLARGKKSERRMGPRRASGEGEGPAPGGSRPPRGGTRDAHPA